MTNALSCSMAFNYHDSSVSFALDDKVSLVLEAERIFRKKKMGCNPNEMEELIKYGLNILNKNIDDISYWALCTLQNPWLEESDKHPNDPFWKKVKILGKQRECLIVNHHLSHASNFLFSPVDQAIILTCDGGGDFGERVAVYQGKDNKITKQISDINDFITAKPYDLCATYLYGISMCEGKFMALAAFGEPKEEYLSKFEELLPILCTTDYKTGDEILSKAFPNLKGKASSSNKEACDFASSLQHLFVKHRIRDIEKIVEEFNPKNLILSGGACLNLEVNTEVWRRFKNINTLTHPCCDDTGQSFGALSYLIAEVFDKRPNVKLPYLGYGQEDFDFSEDTINMLVEHLLNNEIILVHNSKAEIGPRALGNRSIITRPDSGKIKAIVSEKIKQRETYRPLAPIVLESKVHEYFSGPKKSPYMLDQYQINNQGYLLEGCKHIDNTARAQTISKKDNLFIYNLLKKFGERTGIYVLINTSLNMKGVPISNAIGNTLNISKQIKYNHKVVYNGRIIK